MLVRVNHDERASVTRGATRGSTDAMMRLLLLLLLTNIALLGVDNLATNHRAVVVALTDASVMFL